MTTDASKTANANAALQRLEAVKAKRGYLLPHHGLLAISAPQLLEAYDACYTALTLTPRTLSEADREFVWLGVLTSRREHIASHHLVKFLKAGGSASDVDLAIRLTALAEGSGAFAFISDHWQKHMPDYDGKVAYFEALNQAASTSLLRAGLIHLLLAAVHGCLVRPKELRWHIAECYRLEVPEAELVEALTYIMFSGSVPSFIEACRVWQEMVAANEVAASPPYQQWAAMEQKGQQ